MTTENHGVGSKDYIRPPRPCPSKLPKFGLKSSSAWLSTPQIRTKSFHKRFFFLGLRRLTFRAPGRSYYSTNNVPSANVWPTSDHTEKKFGRTGWPPKVSTPPTRTSFWILGSLPRRKWTRKMPFLRPKTPKIWTGSWWSFPGPHSPVIFLRRTEVPHGTHYLLKSSCPAFPLN
ncbi:hypothetical protein GALMADRAFT_324339 [Galerina marginata CBS 339.88]|uniref:Uncharacterized protein n=1 Tax=Galerina marginata (strain CBS 339.88) TaxID=685588 RepID=A0A067TS31_GALM3|nr:hypothetical protein GALMADRAFT_324339 [Galerina marginata CBS 339.88]